MGTEAEITARLRERIVRALHVGEARAGERLPGVRQVAREIGANPRTVAKAYQALAREGLVEVRGRSGVYAARQDHWGPQLLAETGRWLGGILLEAWTRHIPIPDLADLIRRCTTEARLRAACIADTEDERRAICDELTRGFGIESAPLPPAALADSARSAAGTALRRADLVVATPFHAGASRGAAEAMGKPLVLATLHPDLVAAVQHRLRQGRLTIVCADPLFGERVRTLHGSEAAGAEVRTVLAGDTEAVARLDPAEPVLLTRAARDAIARDDLTPLLPFIPFLSPDSARQIAELMVRLHMEAAHGR